MGGAKLILRLSWLGFDFLVDEVFVFLLGRFSNQDFAHLAVI